MKRRFLQFILGGLLGALAALVCLLLGGWHLLDTYGNRLDIEGARIGEPIRAKASCFCLFGPPECEFELGYRTADMSPLIGGGDGTYGTHASSPAIKRSWGCIYTMESSLDPVDHPCQLNFYFKRFDWPIIMGGPMGTLQRKIVDVK